MTSGGKWECVVFLVNKEHRKSVFVFVFIFIVQGDCDADGRCCDCRSHHAGDGPEIL